MMHAYPLNNSKILVDGYIYIYSMSVLTLYLSEYFGSLAELWGLYDPTFINVDILQNTNGICI